jgi:hypothetical protein
MRADPRIATFCSWYGRNGLPGHARQRGTESLLAACLEQVEGIDLEDPDKELTLRFFHPDEVSVAEPQAYRAHVQGEGASGA